MINECLICGEEIVRRTKTGSNILTKRNGKSVTCSKKCSRRYTFIYRRSTAPYQNKIKDLQKIVNKELIEAENDLTKVKEV
jgi:hypothetical protein|tara:strand:+ start:37406 stop:37648 length:243 start_codon:yes stop_codon:yes gene_type:complete